MSRTAFVTGGTGFLGINLIEELIKNGWEVIAMHRPSSDLTHIKKFNVKLVEGKLDNYESLSSIFPEDVDVVFHTAANTTLIKKYRKQQYRDNVEGTKNMVKCAIAKRAKKFIFTSSISAYGIHDYEIDENTVSNVERCSKSTYYDLTKYYAEREVKQSVSKGLNAVILNPCRIMGPYSYKGWTFFVKTAYNDKIPFIPSGVGSVCHVRDVANAHIKAVDKGRKGENYLLGGKNTSFLSIVRKTQEILGKKMSNRVTPDWLLWTFCYILLFFSKISGKPPLLTPETVRLLTEKITCNYSKAIKELDYQSSSLEKIIKDIINWLEKEEIV